MAASLTIMNSARLSSHASEFVSFNTSSLAPRAAPKSQRAATLVVQAKEGSTMYRDGLAMPSAEIDAKVNELKKELFSLRMKKATRQDIKTHEFKATRRDIARLLAAKRQKEIEQGISMRESRNMDKARKMAATPGLTL
eukprot:jgi/Mesvir1/6135/Mv00839-RA.1